jgi:hypothetical protein
MINFVFNRVNTTDAAGIPEEGSGSRPNIPPQSQSV